MTLLAAFQTLLLRYTQREDIVVGTPIANRNRIETEGLIGYFGNTLAIRSDLSGNPTFHELLRRVREVCLEAYAHQDLPFEKLVEELQPQRSLSHMPLVQVLFALQNLPKTRLTLPGLEASEFSFDRETSKLDLSLYARETDKGLALWFEYSTDLFDAGTIERMAGHYQILLEGITTNPNRHLSDLPLLTVGEQHRLLNELNNRSPSSPKPELVQQVFEQQVERHPNAVAVACGTQFMTYDALNRRANRIAHRLKQEGVGPESLIGVYLDRSVDMIAALLGILKAGGAYVPIDTSYPIERTAFIMQDALVAVVLTKSKFRSQILQTDAELIDLDDDPSFAQLSVANPSGDATPDQLAYVIYTSGSTGRPKGVAVNHSSVTNLFQATTPVFDFGDADVWTVSHSYAFDFSVWEIFGALLTGGKLLIVPLSVAQAPSDFYQLLRSEHVTVLGLTPSALRPLLVLRKDTDEPLALRLMVVGGEAFPAEMVPEALQWQVPVWNFFGPTETTVWVSIREVEARDSQHKVVPLGGPNASTQIYILDSTGDLLPIGIPGELCIGGHALARCYLNRPDLTAEKFVPDPFSMRPGARIYRTGDLARFLTDGTIEYVGRFDHQIKLRGFRIELGEIEAALSRHPGVQQSVVLLREDVPGEQTLVAYFVGGDTAPAVAVLRGLLSQALPEYMIPADFVALDSLPLNANGKIDRLALPQPNRDRSNLEVKFVPPHTELEKNLAEIWTAVLRRDLIGVRDNFFELGGHSLMATQLVARIRSQLNVDVPLRRLFEAPTIEGLAKIISVSGSSARLPTIKRRNRQAEKTLNHKIEELSEAEIDSMLMNVKPGQETHR